MDTRSKEKGINERLLDEKFNMFMEIVNERFRSFVLDGKQYQKCRDSNVVYDMGTGTELISDGEALRKAVSYDEKYIYIEAEIFQELIKNSTVSEENICFYCSGYYKMPGIGRVVIGGI